MRKRLNIHQGDVLKVIHFTEDENKKKEYYNIIEEMEGNHWIPNF